MKNARYAIVLASLITAALVGTGFAQTSIPYPLKANIPFDFQVGNNVMPAGEYQLEPLSSTLLIRSTENSAHAAMILVGVRRSLKEQEKSKLVFHKYGSNYFLSNIWVAGETAGSEVPTSNREKEIARSGGATEVALLLRR